MTDEILIRKANDGDMEAMEELIHLHKRMVNRIAQAYFLSDGDQNDIIQEGMIGLFKAIRNFSPEKNVPFEVFARLCINRQIYSAIKKSNRNKNLALNNFVQLQENLEETGTNPEEIFLNKEYILEFSKILSPLEKKVLDLFLQGLSNDDIACATSLSYKSIDNALQRIKKKSKENRK